MSNSDYYVYSCRISACSVEQGNCLLFKGLEIRKNRHLISQENKNIIYCNILQLLNSCHFLFKVNLILEAEEITKYRLFTEIN